MAIAMSSRFRVLVATSQELVGDGPSPLRQQPRVDSVTRPWRAATRKTGQGTYGLAAASDHRLTSPSSATPNCVWPQAHEPGSITGMKRLPMFSAEIPARWL